jgi:hypothetical protein
MQREIVNLKCIANKIGNYLPEAFRITNDNFRYLAGCINSQLCSTKDIENISKTA